MRHKQFLFFAVLMVVMLLPSVLASQSDVQCWNLVTQSQCDSNNNNGCIWKTISNYFGGNSSYCNRATCYDGDKTNQTYCESPAAGGNVTLKSFNLSCTWTANGSLCDPVGGNFFGNGCNDFDNNAQGCYNAGFCVWNSSSSTCLEPAGGFANQSGSSNNPGCGSIINQQLCQGINGCSFSVNACSGNAGGIKCSDLNKTTCPEFTMLSTCCSWNGTNCSTSYDKKCYENTPDFPAGASYCEDYNSFKSQGLCENLTQSPWYMPCKWDNTTNECHYNSGAFGGNSNFNEISTQTGCEALGGQWKTQQYATDGTTKTDTWCEFKFGYEGGGESANCDTGCWGCEAIVSSAKGNTTSQAQSICEKSAVGYCEFRSDSNAQNGLGWCYPKASFIDGGGKHCDEDCGSCEFLNNPQAQCQNSTAACVWVTDTGAPNTAGYCFGTNEKRCGNDCFSCFTEGECGSIGNGGDGVCNWDPSLNVCKPAGFTGEICFDGSDNDNDNKIDCDDSECATNDFCGGDDLSGNYGNCPSYTTNSTCESNGCIWYKDLFQEKLSSASTPGKCDYPGSQCWRNDFNPTGCGNTSGCTYSSQSNFCGINTTLSNNCFAQRGASNCTAVAGCFFRSDPYSSLGGYCESISSGQCYFNKTRQLNITNCEVNETISNSSIQICDWYPTEWNANGGWCQPTCWSLSNTTGLCNNALKTGGQCESFGGYCEPVSSGSKCYSSDGNKTKCEGSLNATCVWFNEKSPKTLNNSVGPAWVSGWCDPKGEKLYNEYIGEEPPVVLGTDPNESVTEAWDLTEIALRDDFNFLTIGAAVGDRLTSSALCNGTIGYSELVKGSGRNNHTFFFYLDSDGNTSNSCTPRDNSSMNGFEFSFKYQDTWENAFGERKGSYQCINGTWGPLPVPLTLNQRTSCQTFGGAMLGIEKEDLFKNNRLYKKSKDLRIYVAVSSLTGNDTAANDSAGPFYFSQGAYGSEFEDCTDSGADRDGDGLKSSSDPDCSNYLKFGYIPSEVGFQCGDSQDNDGDGAKDCDDGGCKSDPFLCGGSLSVDVNDKSAPKINWLQADTFHDSAFVMYDTNEPSNGTFAFYNNDSNCKTINKTIKDEGLFDEYVPDYKMWHDAQLDAFPYNSQAFVVPLPNATTFFYKTTVCDVSGNCAVSGCMNFTTKGSLVSCKSCTSTLAPVFTAQSGQSASGAMGNLSIKIVSQAGNVYTPGTNAASGSQINHTEAKNFNLVIENPNAGNTTNWRVTFINASVSGKIPSSIQNFTGGTDVLHNRTNNGSYVGLGSSKCQEIVNTFRPKRIEIGVPGNFTTELWHCNSGLSNCTDVSVNATHPINGSKGIGGYYNSSANRTLWVVPAEWGC